MGRRAGMKLERRQTAIGMLTAGMKVRHVARHFRVNESTIGRLKRRFNETGRVADRPRTGRPRKTTPREDRFIVTSSRRIKPVYVQQSEDYNGNTDIRYYGP